MSLLRWYENTNNMLPYWERRAFFHYKEDIIHKADGYYFKDHSINGNDGKIINGSCIVFANNDAYINLSTIAASLSLVDNAVTVFRALIKLDNISDLTERFIYYGGADSVASKGFQVSILNGNLKFYISNGTARDIFTTTYTVPDTTNYYELVVSIDLSARSVIVSYGELTETFNITITGGSYNKVNGNTITIGRYANGANLSIIYANLRVAGELKFDFLCKFYISRIIFNRATGLFLENVVTHCSSGTQDIYPFYLLHGYQSYIKEIAPYDTFLVPTKSDGTFGSPVVTGYTKQADYLTGVGYNPSPENIYIHESLTLSYSGLYSVPFKKFFYKFDGEIIKNMFYFSSDVTDNDLNRLVSFLGFNRIRTVVNIGDSISCGSDGPLVADLPALYQDDQPMVKIYDLVSATLQTLTKDNSDQAASSGLRASHLLSFAKNFNRPLYITGKGLGGTSLTTHWLTSPKAQYVTDVEVAIQKTIFGLISDNYYPHFEFYCSLGHNDASLGGMTKELFKSTLQTFIAYWRSFIGQSSAEWHHLPCRKRGDVRTSVAIACEEVAAISTNVFVYDPENLTFQADNVHPDLNGTIAQGIMLETKNHMTL